MKSKARFIPLVAIAAIAMSLVFILPVFSATGAVEFIEYDDSSATLSWAAQGGQIGVEVTDSDLNVAIKRVLLPSDYTANAATVTIVAGAATATLSATTTASATASTTLATLALGDSVVIGSETLRSISSIAMTTGVITFNKAIPTGYDAGTAINKLSPTLADADSVAVNATTCPTCAAAEEVAGTTFSSTGQNVFTLASVPMIDQGGGTNADPAMSYATRFTTTNADTGKNNNDIVLLTSAGGTVSGTTVQAAQESGLLNLAITATSTFYAVYWGSEANDTGTAVKVVSQADPTGITVTLNETGATTGIFRLNVLATTTSDATASPPQLKVAANDVVTLKYTDASPAATISSTVTIETTDPVFSNLLPAEATAGTLTRPEVSGEITDVDSGITKTSIQVLFAIDDDGDGVIDAETATGDHHQAVTVDSTDRTAITGGYSIIQRLPAGMAPETNATIYWWLKATDVALNVGISDRQPTISGAANACDDVAFVAAWDASLIGDNVATSTPVSGCQPYSVKVDFTKPDMTGAVTGPWWDTSKTSTDKTETTVSKAKSTFVRADFAENLDGTTIDATDFEVDDVTPIAATWYSGNKDAVFLEVAAMASNLRPKVELVGEIKDVAGNPQDSDSVALSTDGISPTLTVTLTGTATGGTRQVTTGKITIDIVSNEDVGQPTIAISPVENSSSTTASLGDAISVTPELTAARTYQATYTGTTAGLYNVYVTALDTTASNSGDAGVNNADGAVSFLSTSKSLLYEIDTAAAAPVFSPATTDDVNTYITVDFAAGGDDEGDEYTEADGTANANYDTNDTMTITSATLKSGSADAVDITLSSTDNKTFFYKASDLSIDSHVVTVTATDVAGNKLAATSGTVKVTERKPFAMALNPGWNMVSIPGDAADSDINTVVPATHPADTVLTYDPSVAGGWLTAIRGDDGLFAGTLTSITSGRAYWVHTTTYEAISVTIPKLASGVAVLPPTIPIVIGWNFVPVLDVEGSAVKTGDNAIAQATYLSGLTVSRVYNFGTIANAWVEISTTDNMETGKGYWVYASKVGTLVP